MVDLVQRAAQLGQRFRRLEQVVHDDVVPTVIDMKARDAADRVMEIRRTLLVIYFERMHRAEIIAVSMTARSNFSINFQATWVLPTPRGR
jgi:hypothetical protein